MSDENKRSLHLFIGDITRDAIADTFVARIDAIGVRRDGVMVYARGIGTKTITREEYLENKRKKEAEGDK